MDSQCNDFIDRSFRDVADADYIAARICWKRQLDFQFYWMAEQAVEKYLKGIMLYSRIDVRRLNHDLPRALQEAVKIADIGLEPEKWLISFIDLLNQQGQNRYFECNLRVKGDELLLLDKCVWHIRIRCVALDSTAERGGKLIWTSEQHFKKIKEFKTGDKPRNIWIPFGKLEKILSGESESRRDLTWKNFWFGRYSKGEIKWRNEARYAYPAHVNTPAIFRELNKLVKFSPKTTAHFSENATKSCGS